MCGIVGCVGTGNIVPRLVDCLKRLEYRGYDSAGLAVVKGRGLHCVKTPGPIEGSEDLFRTLSGSIGIGHTRWATHGPPSERNAHPHTDCRGRIAVVHNGIIENYEALKSRLTNRGHSFASETDTEVIPHLLEEAYQGDLETAVRSILPKLQGSFALAVIAAGSPVIVGVRKDAPLAVGLAAGETLLASDIPALLLRTRRVIFLEDGELAVLARGRVVLRRFDGTYVKRRPVRITWKLEDAERAGYEHFMLKEIQEQPRALRNTLTGKLGDVEGGLSPSVFVERAVITRLSRVLLTGCGSSYHAALFGKTLFQRFARLPAEAWISSELRHEADTVGPGDFLIALSQSGETADTLAAVRAAKAHGAYVLSVSNAVGSSMTREADIVLYTHAGPEISVAATKTFTTQLAVLGILALHFARIRSVLSPESATRHADELRKLPGLVAELLDQKAIYADSARGLARAHLFFFLGRGLAYPIALEGALKLQEIAYIPAGGYPAGELKHGPLALVDASTPVIGLALPGPTYSKLLSNLKEVKAREAPVYAVALKSDREISHYVDGVFPIPDASELSATILSTISLQLLSYEIARSLGRPIDRPRHLAKSVTVE